MLPWIAGFRAFEGEVTTFADLRRELAAWQIDLREDGQLMWRAETEIGTWRLAAAEDPLLGDALAACPLVGPRLGAIEFDVYGWGTSEDERHELFCGLLKEGRDVIAHRPTQRRWSSIVHERRDLDACTGKYAFDDGAEHLTRTRGAYTAWTIEAFEAPIHAAGYAVVTSWSATSHNPLRLGGIVMHGEERMQTALLRPSPEGLVPVGDDRVDAILATLSAEFWLFDFTILPEIEQLFADP